MGNTITITKASQETLKAWVATGLTADHHAARKLFGDFTAADVKSLRTYALHLAGATFGWVERPNEKGKGGKAVQFNNTYDLLRLGEAMHKHPEIGSATRVLAGETVPLVGSSHIRNLGVILSGHGPEEFLRAVRQVRDGEDITAVKNSYKPATVVASASASDSASDEQPTPRGSLSMNDTQRADAIATLIGGAQDGNAVVKDVLSKMTDKTLSAVIDMAIGVRDERAAAAATA